MARMDADAAPPFKAAALDAGLTGGPFMLRVRI